MSANEYSDEPAFVLAILYANDKAKYSANESAVLSAFGRSILNSFISTLLYALRLSFCATKLSSLKPTIFITNGSTHTSPFLATKW
eukprot:gene27237-biopygen5054